MKTLAQKKEILSPIASGIGNDIRRTWEEAAR